jgi:hypothetical protein
MVFGRELRLPCDLFFGAPRDKEQSKTDYAVDLVDRLHDIHHYARQHLKVANDRIEGPLLSPAQYRWIPGRRQSLAYNSSIVPVSFI